jgi:hypothetical protein
LIAIAILSGIQLWNVYVTKFASNDPPDDWHDRILTYKMMKKNSARHKEYVGSFIKVSGDKSILYRDKNDIVVRKFKEE